MYMQNISKNIQKGINGIPINLLTKFKNDKNLNQAIKYSLPLLQKCKGNINLQDNIINSTILLFHIIPPFGHS